MSPPMLIKDNKDPLLIGGDGDVHVVIVKDKTDKNATCGEKQEKQQTTEAKPPIKTITQQMVIQKKTLIFLLITAIFAALFVVAVVIVVMQKGYSLHCAGQTEKEVTDSDVNQKDLNQVTTKEKSVTSKEKFYKIADSFWSSTPYCWSHRCRESVYFHDLNKANCERMLDDLEAINTASFTRPTSIDFKVLKFMLRSYLDGDQWREFGMLNSINFLDNIMRPPFWHHHKEHIHILSLYDIPDEVSNVINAMTTAMQLKRTNHNTSMVRIPDMIDAYVTHFENSRQHLLYAEPHLIEDFNFDDGALDSWMSECVLPPMKSLKSFIVEKYIPAGRLGVGVNSYDRGDEYYAACLRHFVSKNVTVDEVRNTGIKEVARIKGLMEKIMNDEGFNGTLREYFTYLSTERVQDFYNRTDDELLSEFRDIIKNRINPKLQEIFYKEHIPDHPISVTAMDQDLLPSSYADNGLSLNLWRPETRPTFLLMAVALHESNPGHHLQASYSKKHFDLPYRHVEWPQEHHSGPSAVPAFTSYVEGWGSYAEYLGEELGLYNSSRLELFGRYSEEMLRACRLVIDTGIHAFGMTRAEAIEYLQEHVAIPIAQIEIEVDRVITWPGQASSYKMGEMAILKLRRYAEKTLGELFEIKDFHKTVLDVGRVPLEMLESVVRVWIVDTYFGFMDHM